MLFLCLLSFPDSTDRFMADGGREGLGGRLPESFATCLLKTSQSVFNMPRFVHNLWLMKMDPYVALDPGKNLIVGSANTALGTSARTEGRRFLLFLLRWLPQPRNP